MLKLSKMVNFRTTPERYEQLKALAEQMPYPKTVANLITHGLALVEQQLAGLTPMTARADRATSRIVDVKRPRPRAAGRKTPAGPRKRKT